MKVRGKIKGEWNLVQEKRWWGWKTVFKSKRRIEAYEKFMSIRKSTNPLQEQQIHQHEEPDLSVGWTCPTCKKKLPSGIVGISNHWAECGGKGFHEALIKAKENGELTLEKVQTLREEHPPSGEPS